MRRKSIDHNNLLPWFTQDHGTLPASYLRSCEEFFKSLKQQAASSKLDKQQAASYSRIIKENKK
jgi:hypothetical protein